VRLLDRVGGSTLSGRLAVIVILVGIMTTVGWIFGLQGLVTVLPGLPTAILLSDRDGRQRPLGIERATLLFVMCGAVVLLGGLSLIEHFSSLDFGIDQALIQDTWNGATPRAPGRMSPITAVNFVMLGCALLTELDRARNQALRSLARENVDITQHRRPPIQELTKTAG